MINANELRIGNWVTGNFPYMIVKTISNGSFDLYMPGSDADDFSFDDNEIDPIPLTPEILEKCGFVAAPDHDEYGGWLSPKITRVQRDTEYRMRIMKDSYGFYYTPDSKSIIIRVDSVHKLQNLFYIYIDSELEVNLK